MSDRRAMEKSLKSYGTKEAAEFLRISPGSMCRRAASGELVGYKPGRRWVFLEEDLIAYLKSTQPYVPQLPHVHHRSVSISSKPASIVIEEMLREIQLKKKNEW